MREKEPGKQPLSWEIADPKPPIIQSGHMENRIRNETVDKTHLTDL